MSNKGKVFIIVCLVSCFFIRCTYHKKEASDRFNESKKCSEKAATASIYREVYKQATDTVYNWVINGLRSRNDKWQIDSLICFNKVVDKVIMSINSRSYYPGSTIDDLQFLYGVKIKEKWYFFTGATCYLPRKNYQKDTHTPLSFAKLHEIAMKEVFNGYLIEKKTKKDLGWWKNIFSPEYEYKYEINDHFFNELNIPLVAFSERKTNPNCPFSCRVIDNKKEYAECLLKKQALSVWNEERAFIKNDTYLYAPELPIGEKVISKINKGGSFKVLEYIDNTEWVYVRMSDHNPNLGLIHKKEISKSKPSMPYDGKVW